MAAVPRHVGMPLKSFEEEAHLGSPDCNRMAAKSMTDQGRRRHAAVGVTRRSVYSLPD